MSGLFGTGEASRRALLDQVQSYETASGILSISLIHGLPWSDIAYTGAAVLVMFEEGRQQRARAAMLTARLANAFFNPRELGARAALTLADAIGAAFGAHAADIGCSSE